MPEVVNGYTDDPAKWNPKMGLGPRRKGTRIWELGELKNPIPDEINDPSEVQEVFSTLKLVPYAGTVDSSGDNLLNFYIKMSELASTQAACRESIKKYGFGKIDVVRRADPDFELEQETAVDLPTKQSFVSDVLNQIDLDGSSWADLTKNLYDDGKKSGNNWLMMTLVETAGQRTAALKWMKVQHVRFVLPRQNDDPRAVAISPLWTQDYLRKNPPDIVPVFPLISDEGDGVFRSIIHWKNGPFQWYGRPDSVGSILQQYRIFQDDMYQIKSSANEYTGRTILETEDDDPEETNRRAIRAGFQNEAHRMEENFTNKGSGSLSFTHFVRPYGAKPMAVHQLQPNTNQDWFDVMGGRADKVIVMSNQWSAKLLYDDTASGLSNNIIIDALKSKLPVVRDNQAIAEKPINVALGKIVEWFGMESQFLNLGIDIKSPYAAILEDTGADPEGGDQEAGSQPGADMSIIFNAYGIAVRSGSVTPQIQDEEHFRNLMGWPEISPEAMEAWADDEGVRRPITLSSKREQDAQIEKVETTN